MTALDDLLTEARPRVTADTRAVIDQITRHRVRRNAAITSAIVLFAVGSATAAAAATGTLDDIVSAALGQSADAAFHTTITASGTDYDCTFGMTILPERSNPEFVEADYTALKNYARSHDWSSLVPDPALLASRPPTAENLADTVSRQIVPASAAATGAALASISSRGTSSCEIR